MTVNDPTIGHQPSRVNQAVDMVMRRFGLDSVGGYGWIVDEAHLTGVSLTEVVAQVLAWNSASLDGHEDGGHPEGDTELSHAAGGRPNEGGTLPAPGRPAGRASTSPHSPIATHDAVITTCRTTREGPREAPTNAQIAVREAGRALTVGALTSSPADPVSDTQCRGLALDVAATLESVADLIRTVSLEAAPASTEAHTLYAVAQQVSVAAALAARFEGTTNAITAVAHGSGPEKPPV